MNTDMLSEIMGALRSLTDRVRMLERVEVVATPVNADTVDLIHAATTATANQLLALDAAAKLPADITGDADTVDDYHAWELLEYPDRVPASPAAQNDEFTAAALDGKWTETTGAGAHDHAVTLPSHIHIKFTGNQSYAIAQTFQPAAAFSVTVCFRCGLQTSGQRVAITAYKSDESAAVQAWYGNVSGAHYVRLWSYSGWTQRKTITVSNQSKCYLHLKRGASNDWTVWFSFDGHVWQMVETAVYNQTFAVHHITVDCSQGGATNVTYAAIDWTRFNWLTL